MREIKGLKCPKDFFDRASEKMELPSTGLSGLGLGKNMKDTFFRSLLAIRIYQSGVQEKGLG